MAYTLIELANQVADGKILPIVNVLAKTNEIFRDAVWVPSNQITTHVYTKTVVLPVGTVRQINKGVDYEEVETRKEEEPLGILESRSKVDEYLLKLSPEPQKFRSSRDKLHVEGMNQTIATNFIYGDVSNGDMLNGLATRYNSLSLSNVIGNGGTGSDLTSIWLLQWGEGKVYFVYPPNSKTMGVEMNDLGRIEVYDSNGKPYQAWVTQFVFNWGLVIENDKAVQRIANIETSGTTNIFNSSNMNAALNKMMNRGSDAVIYCNNTIFTQIDNDAEAKTNVNYSAKDPYGYQLTTYKGRPLRLVEAILDTESALS